MRQASFPTPRHGALAGFLAMVLIAPLLSSPAEAQGRGQGGGGTPQLIETDTVRLETVAETTAVIGRIVPLRGGDVSARISGPVDAVFVEVGDRVRRGDRLVLIVDDRLKWDREEKAAELREFKARGDTARTRLALASQELQRMVDLQASAAFSRARFDDKQLEVARLRTEIAESDARIERAEAALAQTETRLRNTVIEAPYDGIITRRHTETGAFLREGDRVVSMVSATEFEVEANIAATRLRDLAEGDRVSFDLGDGHRHEALIRAIIPEEDQRTRTWTVRFTPRFTHDVPMLAANQATTIHVPLGTRRQVLTMAKDALITSRGSPMVFVVLEDRARARNVQIGQGIGDRFEILAGLAEGEVVVTLGNETLQDGRRVTTGNPAL